MSESLKESLKAQRETLAVRADHTILTEAQHAELRQQRADAAFAQERREAERAGQRAALRAKLMRSPERKAVALAWIRNASFGVLVPALVAFAVWSTVGVHAGLVKMMGIKSGTASWWGAWFVEPALIIVVAVIILVKARLREAGAENPRSMDVIEGVALLVFSLGLNVFGAGDGVGDFWPMVGHALGPIACAMVAYLMGVISTAVTDAIAALPIEADAPEVPPAPVPASAVLHVETRAEVAEIEETETVTETRQITRTRTGRSSITDEQRAQVIALIEAGQRPAAIAREVFGPATQPNKITRDAQFAELLRARREVIEA